ncbi:MAG TPA: cupin domain-containing protein [Anaerolineae bacterium]|nr:cupin domain-containing protein [Anaerolineae bacterium]HOQ97856.1 cupin domain-containing protein [Anaerolineae bacterium]HPL26961.1 cupin domain-containing protein [Anaerolineae bacterium]
MDTARVGQVKAYHSSGSTAHILLRSGKFDARNLLITWTVLTPRGQQRGHSHVGSEQAYIFVSGSGRIQVGDERAFVGQGEMVYVPPGTPHAIANTGDDNLVFITVASPPFAVERLFAERERREVRHEPEEAELAL